MTTPSKEALNMLALTVMQAALIEEYKLEPEYVKAGILENPRQGYCGAIHYTKWGKDHRLVLLTNEKGLPVSIDPEWLPFRLGMDANLIAEFATGINPTKMHTEMFKEFANMCKFDTAKELEAEFEKARNFSGDTASELLNQLEAANGHTKH